VGVKKSVLVPRSIATAFPKLYTVELSVFRSKSVAVAFEGNSLQIQTLSIKKRKEKKRNPHPLKEVPSNGGLSKLTLTGAPGLSGPESRMLNNASVEPFRLAVPFLTTILA